MDERRKRLHYQSWHRGMKETDLILGTFADRYLAILEEAALDQFEELLACSDQQIYAWIADREEVPGKFDNEIMDLLRELEINPKIS